MTGAYLYDAIRTPFGRHGGALAGVRPDDLAAHVLRELLARSPGLDPARIDDVLYGTAPQEATFPLGRTVTVRASLVGRGEISQRVTLAADDLTPRVTLVIPAVAP